MKKIIGILVSLMMCFTLTSCVATATAQVDDMYDDIDVSLVITYGTPFYNTEGLILYYIYRDMFYYPYIYHDRYYFHRYRRPLPPNRSWRYKPLPRDFYMHNKPSMPPRRPNGFIGHEPNRINPNNTQPRRNNEIIRPNQQQTRPNTNFGSSRQQQVRPTTPNVNRGTMNVRPTTPSSGGNMRPTTPPRTTNRNGNFGGGRR